jgi:hypothetical protein
MIKDIKLLLSSRKFMAILIVSAFLRLLFFIFLLPNKPSSFGPDEGTYASLARYVSESLPVEDFPAYGPGLYNSARSIIVPSSLLIKLGMGELDSVRLVSTVYGLISTFALGLCYLAILKLRRNNELGNTSPVDNRFLTLTFVFTFLPSNFIWSTIGLRESGSQFWLIATFLTLINTYLKRGFKSCVLGLIAALALTMAFGTRPQTALVFSVCAATLTVVVAFKIRRYTPLLAVVIGFFAGQAFTSTPKVHAEARFSAIRVIDTLSAVAQPSQSAKSAVAQPSQSAKSAVAQPSQSEEGMAAQPSQSAEGMVAQPSQSAEAKVEESPTKKSSLQASILCKEENVIIKVNQDQYLCKSTEVYKSGGRNPITTLQRQLLTAKLLEYKRNVNTLDAQSALPVSDCQGTSVTLITIFKCNLRELPYRLFAFLFRPLIFLDSGSSFLVLAAVENIFWALLISLILLSFFRATMENSIKHIAFGLLIYLVGFSMSAALYEGNLGTAFRHKSTILWVSILILMIAKGRNQKLSSTKESSF